MEWRKVTSVAGSNPAFMLTLTNERGRDMNSIYGKECKEIKWTRKFKKGDVLQRELITLGSEGCWMTVAYTHKGEYIGDSKTAYRLCVKRRIVPEKITPNGNVCSIGYSFFFKKWYGWSHRAICGFKIGDVVKKGDCCASSGWTDEYLKDHPDENILPVGFVAKTEEDCKKMAIAFASSVS